MTINRLLLILLAVFLAQTSARAESPAALADAQKKYDAGDFHGAETYYADLASADPNNAALHYDLGNALFKEGRLGPAIASYQRAFDLDPRDSDIRYNLDFALKKSGEELIPPGVPPLMFEVFYLLSIKELLGLAWIFCWAGLLLASLYLMKPSLREKLKPWVAGTLGLWIFWGGWWLARKELEPSERGVIIKSTAEIRNGPGDNFNVSFTAPEGRRVEILAQDGDWLEIGVLKEGAKGWLHADAVEKIGL